MPKEGDKKEVQKNSQVTDQLIKIETMLANAYNYTSDLSYLNDYSLPFLKVDQMVKTYLDVMMAFLEMAALPNYQAVHSLLKESK